MARKGKCACYIAASVVTFFLMLNYFTNSEIQLAFHHKQHILTGNVEDNLIRASQFQSRAKTDDTDIFSRIVYNRVGKCGSRSMQNVISSLSLKNGFQHYASHISNQTRLPILNLKAEVKLISSIQPPMLYSRHIYYMNFEKFGLRSPIYISLIRDPIERFSSHYHFRRNGDLRTPGVSRVSKRWRKGERELNINDCILKNYTECSSRKLWYIIPFFCGQELVCRSPTMEALQIAKQNLLEKFLVVGFLEDFKGALKVFEKLMPYHFKGASDIWTDMSDRTYGKTSTFKKNFIKAQAYSVLRQRMVLDYLFYDYAKLLFKHLKKQLKLK